VIVPVLPSPIDIKAAERFVDELLDIGKVADKKAKAALVANRVKENTLIFEELDEVLSKLKVPYVASFREAQNYIRAYQRGLGIHELPPYLAWPGEQWDPSSSGSTRAARCRRLADRRRAETGRRRRAGLAGRWAHERQTRPIRERRAFAFAELREQASVERVGVGCRRQR
jgi:hypothetical protein